MRNTDIPGADSFRYLAKLTHLLFLRVASLYIFGYSAWTIVDYSVQTPMESGHSVCRNPFVQVKGTINCLMLSGVIIKGPVPAPLICLYLL